VRYRVFQVPILGFLLLFFPYTNILGFFNENTDIQGLDVFRYINLLSISHFLKLNTLI